jgi:hypothetical protein
VQQSETCSINTITRLQINATNINEHVEHIRIVTTPAAACNGVPSSNVRSSRTTTPRSSSAWMAAVLVAAKLTQVERIGPLKRRTGLEQHQRTASIVIINSLNAKQKERGLPTHINGSKIVDNLSVRSELRGRALADDSDAASALTSTKPREINDSTIDELPRSIALANSSSELIRESTTPTMSSVAGETSTQFH